MRQPKARTQCITDAVSIIWREDADVYRPTPRKLADFLSGIELPSPLHVIEASLLVFIEQSCRDAMESHVRSDILKEQAGILCGKAYTDGDIHYVAVTSAMPVDTLNSATHFSFHEKSWETVWARIEADSNVVGWYHSHPGMGVFLSATDSRTQERYFSAPWQIAVVLDPVSGETGIFCGAQGERVPAERVLRYFERRRG